jgi:hypothetical protein
VFGPDHVLLLPEGFRATWTVTRIDPDTETAPAFVRAESPEHLLATGVLGFAALVVPDLVDGSPPLRDAVERQLDGVSIRPVDLDLARRVFAWSSELVDGLVTVLPGSSIGKGELALAASHALRVAVADDWPTDDAR